MWSRAARQEAERDADAALSAASAREVRALRQQLRVVEEECNALEEQEKQLLAEIKQLQSSGQALQASMKKKEKKPLRQQMAQKRKERILLKRQVMLLAPPGINDLPSTCLVHVLVTAVQSDDMLAHAAVVSQVCGQWRRVILNRDPYARALYIDPIGDRPSGAELQLAIDEMVQADDKDLVETGVRGRRLPTKREDRARVLSLIRGQTKLNLVKHAIGQSQSVELAGVRLRDEGARAFASALNALPNEALLSSIILRDNEISESGFVALGDAVAKQLNSRSGMQVLDVGRNPEAGNEGVQRFVARAIADRSSTGEESDSAALSELRLDDVGCGDTGMVALATALPLLSNWKKLTTKPASLRCGSNPDVCIVGWTALAEALPKLLGLAELDVSGCYGMGDAGAVALCEALAKHSGSGGGLNLLAVDRCGIGNEGGFAIAHVVRLTPSLLQLSARRNLIDEPVQATIREVAKFMRLKLRLKEL